MCNGLDSSNNTSITASQGRIMSVHPEEAWLIMYGLLRRPLSPLQGDIPSLAHLSRRPSSCSSLPPLQQLQRIPLYIHNSSESLSDSPHCLEQALPGEDTYMSGLRRCDQSFKCYYMQLCISACLLRSTMNVLGLARAKTLGLANTFSGAKAGLY